MNRKIEFIQDYDNPNKWHWVILEYDEGWCNIGHGLENSFEIAVAKAKEEYDRLN